MSTNTSNKLGTQPVGKLMVAQSIPAAIGILVMSLNMLIDTIFVGNWIGVNAISAITVVLPITFLIASVGMAIGIGGASIISRALGKGDINKVHQVFGNQIALSLGLSIFFTIIGLFFSDAALTLFGASGEVIEPARAYYMIVMYGVPFLSLVMTGNPIIRAEGRPTFSMIALIVPAVVNIILDYYFISYLDLGIDGAAWATTFAYFSSFLFILWFFLSKNSELSLKLKCLKLQLPIVKEIGALGGVTLARQGVVSILSIILNHSLVSYGGEIALAVYGIISRMLMFALFPVMGITQGFMPIAGYNYGANNFGRLKETMTKSILYASILAITIFIVIMAFPAQIVGVFTQDVEVLKLTPNALRTVFAVTPLIAIQLIGSAYFQAIGKVRPALLLTLTKQGFFLIPLILILPQFFGLFGIWISFPIADFLATTLTAYFLNRELKQYLSTE
jgi:putative MATE family efflux protein